MLVFPRILQQTQTHRSRRAVRWRWAFTPFRWPSRRTVGSVAFSRCRTTPYCHLIKTQTNQNIYNTLLCPERHQKSCQENNSEGGTYLCFRMLWQDNVQYRCLSGQNINCGTNCAQWECSYQTAAGSIDYMVWKEIHGSQWVPSTVGLPTSLNIFFCVQKKKELIQVE